MRDQPLLSLEAVAAVALANRNGVRRMTRVLILATLTMMLATPASARCILSHCKDKAPTRSYITNTHRQIVGDLYSPGHGRRVQIRDKHRRILGYVEMDGTITNPSRQKVGSVEALR